MSETDPHAPQQAEEVMPGDHAASSEPAQTAPLAPEQTAPQMVPPQAEPRLARPAPDPSLAPSEGEDWQIPAQMLYSSDATERSFLTERRGIQNALARALDKPAAQWGISAEIADALLAQARLHYRHAQGPEGLSVLEGLDRANLSGGQELRRAVMELALGLIDPRDTGLTQRAQAMLGPAYASWPDQPVFIALLAIRKKDYDQAADLLPTVQERMQHLPKGYREAILPGLLEAAIASEDWRSARDFALDFRKHAGLRDSSAFHYLLGRAAEAGQDLLAAFDSYALAGKKHDLYGHRARTAVVAMGLRHDLMDIPEARELLERESNIWRGDDYALAVLTDLAALDRADGDRVAAVHTYGSILDRFPEKQEAGLARQKARALISELYAEGASGELPLSDFLRAHRKIAPDFRFEPGFDVQGEKFADRFLSIGSTLVAAQEYEAVHDHLAVARDLGLAEVTDVRLDELRLKQARSLEMGGRYDDALSALREPLASGETELEDQRGVLLAKLYASTGQGAAVLETAVARPDMEFLRLKAKAYFDREDWPASQGIYQQMWDEAGQELPFEDAINLLLASYRGGDWATTLALSQDFPELTSIPQWSTIAQGLLDPGAALWPLREDTARMRMNSAASTLETVEQAVQDPAKATN
ncbi:hypothetical protein [Pseudooceanicola nitratireducens]|uniref:hypothetical protein n=1 Tax=Pseudooceanicola nitratireducens TaxID=517719 RepID=UPI001C93B11C|nr:hypothetical protein [Pseudooceanicola nitratireducens]MBY6159035.1 hypothetical protein [Pseudooceanicola nitratireducens]